MTVDGTHVPWTPDTDETEFGLWPTPNTQEVDSDCELTKTRRRLTKDGRSSHSLNLAREVKMWPTPNAVMVKNVGYDLKLCEKRAEKHQTDLAMEVKFQQGGGSLNPTWVEWLMGFPQGWTDLKR